MNNAISSGEASPSPLRTMYKYLTYVVLPIVFSVVFTSLIIQYSCHHGKLTADPRYDDVAYLLDSIERLRILDQNGLSGLIHNYIANPPKTPFSTLGGLCAFKIFGVYDWAPYTTNFFIVLVYFGLTTYLTRRLRFWQRLTGLFFIASVPMVALAVYEYRPDACAAALTTAGIFLTLSEPFYTAGKKRKILIGLFFGAALLVKPTVFPSTLAIFSLSLLLAIIRDSIVWERKIISKSNLTDVSIVTFSLMLLAGIHYFLAWKQTIVYIQEVMLGPERKVWRLGANFSISEHLTFYLNGPAAQMMLGAFLPVLASVITFASFINIVLFKERFFNWTYGALVFLLAFQYLIPTINPTKTPFFGLGFFTYTLFFTIYSFSQALELINKKNWIAQIAANGLYLTIIIYGCCQFRFPAFPDSRQLVERQKMIGNRLYEEIAAISPSPNPSVDVTTVGNINNALLMYIALKKGRRLNCEMPKVLDNLETVTRNAEHYDFIVLSESGTPDVAEFIPFTKFQDQLIRHLNNDNKFFKVDFLPTLNGRGFYLYAKRKQVNKPL